jgi:hypothetical protein
MNITQAVDKTLTVIQFIIMSFLTRLGPFFVALMPALFTAYSIYHTFDDEAGQGMALFFAVVVGFAMEAVGIVATHTAIDLYNAQRDNLIEPVKFQLMAWLVPVYVIGVAAVVFFSKDAFSPLVKGLGVASPFLTCIVYIAIALARDLSKIETKASEQAQRAHQKQDEQTHWEREKELLEIKLKHQERLAKIEAKVKPKNTAHQGAYSPQNGANGQNSSPPLRVPKGEWRAKAAEIFAENPEISGAELGRLVGASERTGQNILKEIEAGQVKVPPLNGKN